MNEHDFDGDHPRQLLVCTFGADCGAALKRRDGEPAKMGDRLKEERTAAGLKRELYIIKTGCQGWCQEAPVCQLLPEGRIFRDLRVDEAAELVRSMAEGGEAFRDRLVWDYSRPRSDNEKLRSQGNS